MAKVGAISVAGHVNATGGSLTAATLTSKNLSLKDAAGYLTSATITGAVVINGGSLNAGKFSADTLSMREDLKAAFEELTLTGSTKTMIVGALADAAGGAEARVNTLNLNGGSLVVGAVTAAPVALAAQF